MYSFEGLYPILEHFGHYDAQIKHISFVDKCACLSGVTITPCCLDIEITTMFPFTYETQCKINERIHQWAEENLSWEGCYACSHGLSVDCRLFPEKSYKEDWAICQPVKKVLINSSLYTGKDAIDILNTLVQQVETRFQAKCPPIVIIVHLQGRKRFMVSVRKIDTYGGYIEMYTNVGVLPLYADTPTPITKEVVEAIEIPNKIEV